MASGMLVDGEWINQHQLEDTQGRFVRASSGFRDRVTADGSSGFVAEAGRYHLYIAWTCPWAHRTAIMRRLKGLDEAVSLSVVAPHLGNDGWRFSEFPGAIPDTINGAGYLREIYTLADPKYTGRVTVPVLWDRKQQTIVNNESREIMRMFDTEFDALATRDVDFWSPELRETIDRTIDALYDPVNNGVYRAGFATTQTAYDEAVTELFAALDYWEGVLSRQRYLCGDRITEADWCLFTTLVRFDSVYHGLLKCNRRRIVDYPNLSNYLKDLYQQPGVAETVHMDHIKQGYYESLDHINPTGIVPQGPMVDFTEPHGRERLTRSAA